MSRPYSKRKPPRRREPANFKMAIIVASIVTVIMLCLAMFTDGIENAPEWTLFLGHFHPALLHLPIGFYTILAVLEYLDSSKSGPRIGKACEIVLNYTAIVAVIAAVLGKTCGACLAFGCARYYKCARTSINYAQKCSKLKNLMNS